MTKFAIPISAALGAFMIVGPCFAESPPVPVDTEKAVEEMTVIGPRPGKWLPQPMLEQQYFESLQQKFGPQSSSLVISDKLLASQDPLNPRSWYDTTRTWDRRSANLEEIALMFSMTGRSSAW